MLNPVQNQKNKNKSFTLIELLVVISVIGILSAIMFPGYQLARRQLALQRSANKLAQDIRKAQEMAMSAQECLECGGGVPAGGYGVYLNKTEPDRYYIYANTSSPYEKYDSGDIKIETIYLEKEVSIKDFGPSSENFSINFKPPDPIVTIKDAAGQDKNSLTIILALRTNLTKTKTIKVNKVGLVSVE